MKVLFKPLNRSADVEAGDSLLEAAEKAGISLATECGGMGRCGKCKVVVKKGVTPVTPREREYLTPSEVKDSVRLACQTFIKSATSVSLVSVPSGKDRILENGISRSVKVRPAVKKFFLSLTPEELKQAKPVSDIVHDSIARQGVGEHIIPFQSLKTIPLHVSREGGGITAIVKGAEVIGFEPGDTTGEMYGLAVDIGTTTVVGYLFRLNDGGMVAVNSALNDQAVHGADVISRIDHALNAPDGLNQLHQAILNTINQIIENLCSQGAMSSEHIYCLVLVGNTAMNHLFWGISPRFLSRFPYNPLTLDTVSLSARDFGIKMNPSGVIVSLPLVSGFIGSDTIGVVLSTGLHRSKVPKLAIDIGTNGEIVLTDGKSMVACSCAAGPAFEGAHIQCGMRGCTGAVDHVAFADNIIRCHVIDEVEPKGICGSGLVDAIAGMLQEGILEGSGRLLRPGQMRNPAYARLIREGSFREFVLKGLDSPHKGREMVITQKDIREFQLAKGAMTAGIRILMDELSLQDGDIREVYLAGAFGNYVQAKSALAVGLLPPFRNARITQVGNAAGSGAKMALLSTASLKEGKAIAERIKYIELAKVANFQEEFIKGMVMKT
jgi:uncharacterized 2Fe-2S/4Fe-4S cluster protein (DUF4445 family)